VGCLFNIKSSQKIKEVQKIAAEKPIEKVTFGMDVIHGYETTFLFAGIVRYWDMKPIERPAQIAAKEGAMESTDFFAYGRDEAAHENAQRHWTTFFVGR
jgi:beta-glucosidase